MAGVFLVYVCVCTCRNMYMAHMCTYYGGQRSTPGVFLNHPASMCVIYVCEGAHRRRSEGNSQELILAFYLALKQAFTSAALPGTPGWLLCEVPGPSQALLPISSGMLGVTDADDSSQLSTLCPEI